MADAGRRRQEESRHARERLTAVRDGLLGLHKSLLESERVGYERAHGRIGSRQEFLTLALQDEWFAWLRPVSELIVLMDELLQGDEPVTDERASALVERTRHDSSRPLLRTTDPAQTLRAIIAAREPLYAEIADLVVDTGKLSAKQVIRRIMAKL